MTGRYLAAIGCSLAAGLLLGAVLGLAAVNVWEHEGADGPPVTLDRSPVVPGGLDGESVPGSGVVRVDVLGDSATVESMRTRHWEPALRVALLLLLMCSLLLIFIGCLLLLWAAFSLRDA